MEQTHTRTRLHLEGLASPIVTRITHRSRDALTLQQPLPFLQLHRLVEDESGRKGRLEGIDVKMDGNVPHLVLRVSYPPETVPSAQPATRRRDATVPFELPAVQRPSTPPIAVGEPYPVPSPRRGPRSPWWNAPLRWLRRLWARWIRRTTHRLPAPASRG